MSGTSADAIDVAVVDWPEGPDARPFALRAFRERPHAEGLQSEIHRLAAGEIESTRLLEELIRLDRVLADAFADAVLASLDETGLTLASVDAIASHGQTVAHHPERGGSLQIGCPARLAERLGRPVVADFRRRDLACDGEGAPLAPFFHHAVFAHPDESRGVLNLGGIANLTWLPAGGRPEDVIAFDVGPANSLLDAIVVAASEGRERFDRDGERARAGRVVEAWLEELMADPYLARRPPKSTGRERYGTAEARGWLARAEREGVSLADLLATFSAFTVRAIARAWRELARDGASFEREKASRLFVGGGGARNRFLMDSLSLALGRHGEGADAHERVIVESMDVAGVPADAAEAMAFSLLGRNTLLALPNQLPQCTGVAEARVLGVVHGAEWLGATVGSAGR